MNKIKRAIIMTSMAAALAFSGVACGGQQGTSDNGKNTTDTTKKISGKIVIDGSSTVYPISEAVAEEFKNLSPDVDVNIAKSGTGGGMKKFTAGEIDICNASRAIKAEEKEAAKKNGIDFVEFKIAYDGITVVVNKDNNWVDAITTEELKKIWEPNSKVKYWSDVNEKWPKQQIKLYGPGSDSGTFEYFTEEINKKAKDIRTEFTPSEDDNVLVTGVSSEKAAMGYFGYAYFVENKDKIKALTINGVAPDAKTIENGTYKPLSRPLFIYVNKKALEKEQVKEFVKFSLSEGTKVIKDVGFVPMKEDVYKTELEKLK